MKSLKTIKEEYSNKIALVRLDLNVPLKDSKIIDTHRIDKILQTLKFLIDINSNILIISHVGRPKGINKKSLSLQPICNYLERKINYKVILIKDDLNFLKKNELIKKFEKNILVLENIRFYKEEEQNDMKFAKNLANLGDFYVNEAFSCSHRNHASVSNITNYIESFAGFLFEEEINALKKLTIEINKPITCIIGGSKITSKIEVIKNLIPRFNNLIIVGGMANNFYLHKGYKIGKSLYEKSSENIVKNILQLGENNKCSIYIPEDVKVGKSRNDIATNKEINAIENDDMILDIGDNSLIKIEKILENSSTVLWNGPAGYFENPNFSEGSFKIANIISDKTQAGKLYSVIGGGDTVAVINKKELFKKFNFVSTAGGAFLEYLEGKELPGIKALG